MLVLTRKHQERIRIGDDVVLTVLRIKGNTVRLGIEAPRDVRVVRGELPPKDETTGPQLATVTADDGQGDESSTHESQASNEEQPVETDLMRHLVRRRRRRQSAAVAHAV